MKQITVKELSVKVDEALKTAPTNSKKQASLYSLDNLAFKYIDNKEHVITEEEIKKFFVFEYDAEDAIEFIWG